MSLKALGGPRKAGVNEPAIPSEIDRLRQSQTSYLKLLITSRLGCPIFRTERSALLCLKSDQEDQTPFARSNTAR